MKKTLSLPVRPEGFVCGEDNVASVHHAGLFASIGAVKHTRVELTSADVSITSSV